MPSCPSSERFTATVEYYHQFRPRYPVEIIRLLIKECTLNANSVLADIGSGTGIFTELLIKRGFKTFAIEPNFAMRQKAQSLLGGYDNFISIEGTSNQTHLADHCLDCITCAQSFHWFNDLDSQEEFKRILKPNGYVVLIWNMRDNQTDCMKAYEALLKQFGTDYLNVAAENMTEQKIKLFFGHESIKQFKISCQQLLDWASFKGRLLSTSYTPKIGDEHFDEMLAAANDLFSQYQEKDRIVFDYECTCYVGQFNY